MPRCLLRLRSLLNCSQIKEVTTAHMALMKAKETLKAIKAWAKATGQRIKITARKQPPSWIPPETREQSPGIALSLYASDDSDAKKWDYWFPDKGPNRRFVYDRCEEFEAFKDTKNLEELLSYQANEITFFIFFSEIFWEWAKEKNYEVSENTNLQCAGEYYEAREYSPKKDPGLERQLYASLIGFKCGQIILRRMVSLPYRTKESGYNQTTGEWMAEVASNSLSSPIKTKKALLEWLNEYAATGYVTDYTNASLDKKTAKKILQDFRGAVYLYQTESASDEAIKELCNPKKRASIHLSEFTLSCLSDVQMGKLFKYAKDEHGKVYLDIGILSDGKIDETTCRNIIILNKAFNLNHRSIFVDLRRVSEISDKCAAILARCDVRIHYKNCEHEKKVASFALKKTKNTASKKRAK